MADKKGQTIVIKKITVVAGGGHGGSWKVALADFMTALMAFFLTMWLLAQSQESKKAVSDYFSTPSVIEYNFSNFGVELTLEKLFLDLLNEPLKAFQSFLEPIDKTPNTLDMGSAKVVSAFIADQLQDYAKNVTVNSDGYEFQIPDNVLFERGSSKVLSQYTQVLEKLKAVTTGLEDSDVKVISEMFVQAVPDSKMETANKVASTRLQLVQKALEGSFEHSTNEVIGLINVKEKKGEIDPAKLIGFIRISIKQKAVKSDGRKPRKLDALFGESKADMSVYDNFVQQLATKKKAEAQEKEEKAAERRKGAQLKKQIDQDLKKEVQGDLPLKSSPDEGSGETTKE